MFNTSSSTEGIAVDRRSPEAVFGLLGDEIRVGILQALGETPDEPVPFAELHRRVGIRDSGQFNYHLGKLRGSFVRRTPDGYELTYAGRQVIGAIHAGTFTADATVREIPLADACPLCGGALVAAYTDESGQITCTDCAEFHNEFAFPPGSLNQYDRTELPYAFDRWMYHVLDGIARGFCYLCAGRMTGRLVVDDPDDQVAALPAHVEYECHRCGSTARTGPQAPTMFHPAVQGFLFDQGFDTWRDPSWTHGSEGFPETTLRSSEPPEVAVTYAGETASVTAIVGPDASVRVDRATPA